LRAKRVLSLGNAIYR